ncbi:MAG: endolytic transglycosylase MltG [Candidatus Dojkabacteria bacterium]
MESKIKKTQSRYKSCFVLIVGLILIIVAGGFVALNTYNNAIYSPNSTSTDTVIFKVEDGDTLSSVSKTLEQKGLIKNSEILKLYLKINNIDPKIKVGTYSIPKDKSALEIITILEDGVLKPGIRVTLKEGLRHEQIATLVASALGTDAKFTETEFNSISDTPDLFVFKTDVAEFLTQYKPTGVSLEGFLYPDTYEFSTDQSTQQIVEVMIENFINKVNANLTLNNLNLKQSNVTTLYQGLTLASIIEKEASKTDDRAEIAGIFHNRIENGMLLQSDATVNYITGKNDPGVNADDVQIDSPYNTYKYVGLPPTPIDNPRIESIVAALYPNKTIYFYFFHTDDGQTYFSETFEEHQQKACQYRGC